jgi:hypothetical protein
MRFISEPCFNEQKEPDASLCLGGLCLDIGSSGYCTATCSSESCPPGTRCVAFAGGVLDPVCLLSCDDGGCDHDPALACESPGGEGDYSFSVLGSPDSPDGEYCSVKRCDTDAQCGLTGRCATEIGGYCLSE